MLTYRKPVVDQQSTNITEAFLDTGILPVVQESEFVSLYMPGMVREPFSHPYSVPICALAGDVGSGNVTVEVPF